MRQSPLPLLLAIAIAMRYAAYIIHYCYASIKANSKSKFRNRNILDFMRWPQIDLGAQDLNGFNGQNIFQQVAGSKFLFLLFCSPVFDACC
jgi:hypothetical protein